MHQFNGMNQIHLFNLINGHKYDKRKDNVYEFKEGIPEVYRKDLKNNDY